MVNVTVRRQRKAAATGDAATREHPAASGQGGTNVVAATPAAATAGGGEVAVERIPEAQRKPLTPGEMAVSRRQFLNRAITTSFTAFLGVFGMASLSFLWPKLTGGFGTIINAGNYDDLLKEVGAEGGFKPKFIPEGRFWLVYYEGTGDSPVYEITGAKEIKI